MICNDAALPQPEQPDGIRGITTDETGNVVIDMTPMDKKLSDLLEEDEETNQPTQNVSSEKRKKKSPSSWLEDSFLEDMTYKALNDGSVLYMYKGREAFIDHGDHIVMCNENENEERIILGAIKLANEKYHSSFEITGSDEFQKKAIAIMVKYNFDVELKNPAQELIRQEYLKRRMSESVDKTQNGFVAASQRNHSKVLVLPSGNQDVNIDVAQKKRRTRP